jgi:hypothetical protein
MSEEAEVKEVKVEVVSMGAIEAIERGQIDISISTAKKFPRDLATVKADMREMATRDPETAASCSYMLPRAGKMIEGPSVRLAEIAAACYGNLSVAVRVIEQNDEFVKSQAVVHDLQKNVRMGLEIPRNVEAGNNPNPRKLKDARHTAALAANSIAFREAVFKVIPRSLVNPVWEEAKLVAAGSGKSFDEARETALTRFKELGVSRKQVYDYLGVGGLEAISTKHLHLLHGVLTAINDGETSVETEFGQKTTTKAEVPDVSEGHKQANQAIADFERMEAEQAQQQEMARKAQQAAKKEYKLKPKEEVKMAPKETPPSLRGEPPPKSFEGLDPVYERVAFKMQESKVTFSQLLRVLTYWGLPVGNAKDLSDIKLHFIRTADNDWQGVIAELAMNPDEAA